MVPCRQVPLRVAKFDVVLREASLHVMHAEHTILSRMVMFACQVCVERFAAFHPAYDPTDVLDLVLLRKGRGGVAACSIAVATWDGEPPPLKEDESELLVAKQYQGTCLRCQRDIDKQKLSTEFPCPKFSFLNHMDPCWSLPSGEIRELFASATVTEACLVALEHMSVNLHRVMKAGGITKFFKNTISFPQDIATWFKNAGLLRPFREGDSVNSSRGPHGDMNDPSREPVLAKNVSDADLRRFGTDARGQLVFPGVVKEVTASGRIVVEYRDTDRVGLELRENLEHRITLPWSPQVLRSTQVIILRRGLSHGRVLEGLEVRWGLVSRILEVLTHEGYYRLNGDWGSMHRYYDKRLFDVDDEAAILAKYAPTAGDGQFMDCRTAEELARANFDVRAWGAVVSLGEEGDDAAGGCVADLLGQDEVDAVEEDVFEAWLESGTLELAAAVSGWWVAQEPPLDEEDAGPEAFTREELESAACFFERIRRDVAKQAEDEAMQPSGDAQQQQQQQQPQQQQPRPQQQDPQQRPSVPLHGLATWLQRRIGDALAEACWLGEEGLPDTFRMEFMYVAGELAG